MYNQNDIHSPDCLAADRDFAELIAAEAERIRPMLAKQLMREFLTGDGDINEILNIYCRAFNVDQNRELRLIILKPSGAEDMDDFFFIKNTAQQYIGKENLLAGIIINDFVVLITVKTDQTELTALLDKIRAAVWCCYKRSVMAIYSRTAPIAELPAVFNRLRVCTGYSFYAESNRTLYENDIIINNGDITLRPEYGAVEHAVKSGDTEKAALLLSDFFEKLRNAVPTPAVAKTYCMEMYVTIIRCCTIDKIERYMKGIVSVQEAKTLSDIQEFISEKGMEITGLNAPETKKIYSALVRDTIRIIDQNIENENLSLRWLAGTILYTNVDYLGKLFKKETGKNFSHYVMEKRMEMAKELILEGKKDRIYEIAENVGYGSNSQYFSQVFKKYTGVSPLEYKEFARLTREKELVANNS